TKNTASSYNYNPPFCHNFASQLLTTTERTMKKSIKILITVPAVVLTMACAAMAAMMNGVEKPAASEFGYGPRVSATGKYSVTIEETAKYPKHKVLSTTFIVRDKSGKTVDD